MNKKFLVGATIVVLAGMVSAIFLLRDEKLGDQGGITAIEINQKRAAMAAESGETNAPTQAVLVPIDLSHSLRLAIGGLGLADEDKNRQLGDLVTVNLTDEHGFELVERQSLAAVMQELNLNWSGFVRAKDAVRVGKLLKADWFLLGTEAKISGTNSLVVRVVDARTGIMRDAGVFPADQPSTQLAADLAVFMRQCRQNAASPKLRVYLAVGAFEDLSANNRQADFSAQVRGYLTAAYQGSNVTLLEREYVETLLQEVRLDLAGLTEEGGTNSPSPMQSAFWLVSGQYQSYETTNLQVEINLEVQRIFGSVKHFAIRGLPGESVARQIKAAIDETMNQKSTTQIVTRASEARHQMYLGKNLSGFENKMQFGGSDPDLVWVMDNWQIDSQAAARKKRNLEEAIRAFETVVLLEPSNCQAKMYIAACLRNPVIARLDEARNYYREIIEESHQDKWTALAEQALGITFLDSQLQTIESPEAAVRWYESAAAQTTNTFAAAFYSKQIEGVETEITVNAADTPKAKELAEQRLFDSIQSFKNVLQGKGGSYSIDMGMGNYVKVFGSDHNRRAKARGASSQDEKPGARLEALSSGCCLDFSNGYEHPRDR